MSVDVHKMAAALLRHRAGELRKLKGEAFKPVLQKPTPGWVPGLRGSREPGGRPARGLLWRGFSLAPATDTRPWLLFIMLNPSTADGRQDDPTIRKCREFARMAGCAGFEVANLITQRSPKPGVVRALDRAEASCKLSCFPPAHAPSCANDLVLPIDRDRLASVIRVWEDAE